MFYTNEQIVSYLNILEKNKNNQSENLDKVRCRNCREDNFSIYLGQHICDSCGVFNGYVLGYYDISIYARKYHYAKKIEQVSKRINLNDDEQCKLYSELMNIDNNVMKILNKKLCRKRMINIFYLIKKILQEMGCEKYQLVYLKISPQTLEKYEKWWKLYKSLE